ncbi:MAG: hypothetical protein GY856_54345 [bacterium]|nr:hypothetical protein [bacterium]
MKAKLFVLLLAALGLGAGVTGTIAGQGGSTPEQQVERLKALYDFPRWHEETGEVISGVAVSAAVVAQLESMTTTWPQAFYALDRLGDREYTVIRQRWESEQGEVDVTMVVAPTLAAAQEYLIFRYANTQREKPLVMPRGDELGLDLGHLAFVLPEDGSDGFVRIDFLRHNVLTMLRAEGGLRGELRAVAEAIDRELRAKESALSTDRLPERPLIRTFHPQRSKIRRGQKVPLVLDVDSPGDRPLRYFWTMDSGGVEENLLGWFLYYGEGPGDQRITVTVVNDLGLRASATAKLTVTKR